ncbi:hypothetical protein NPIL_520411 [Nephila pilipes]|uniref:Uncharacterized protein n=1 Tax=Nephila pilipes TaxID=299642 RepID=A0A8X6NCZ6_NEPPI|nr:hypothetical protein NPIL_520411 [Nephila pilipes]
MMHLTYMSPLDVYRSGIFQKRATALTAIYLTIPESSAVSRHLTGDQKCSLLQLWRLASWKGFSRFPQPKKQFTKKLSSANATKGHQQSPAGRSEPEFSHCFMYTQNEIHSITKKRRTKELSDGDKNWRIEKLCTE